MRVTGSSLSLTTVRLKHLPEQKVLLGGGGPPLVWLHGVAPATVDDPLLLALAKRWRLIAPLQPGISDLDELEPLPTLHDVLLHYDSLFDALELGSFALAGHGFGALLAGELAALAPSRVEKLALFSPLGLWRDEAPVADIHARPAPAIEELIWQGAVHRPDPGPPLDEDAMTERLLQMANTRGGMAKYTWPIPDRGLEGRLYRIAAPTLVVSGEGDAFIPSSYASLVASGVRNATSRTTPGSHMAAYEDPAATVRILEDFLD